MTLTPDDIERQEFKERFRGYDQQEVDRFLDRVAARISELVREREELARRLRELERQASEGAEAEQLLKRTLVAAQRTADETVAEARAQADQALADVREQAERILADARAESARVSTEAQSQAQRVHRAIDELRRFRGEYRDRVRAVVAEQLDLLDRVGELPDLPSGLEQAQALLEGIAGAGTDDAPAGGRET